MHVMFVWGVVFMIVTGLALYGEGAGMGSWQQRLFSSWVIPLFGQSQDVHTWHHLGMWVIICFAIVHIYAAVREDIMSRQSIISSIMAPDMPSPNRGTASLASARTCRTFT